jgi:glycosyltransferase involved in cell wall biosynthesis
MRTLIVNSMFANSFYRKCADELGALAGMDLTMLTVREWRMNGMTMPFDAIQPGAPYRTVAGKTFWTGYENRGFYTSSIARAFRVAKPEVLFLMEEPFSIFAAEILTAKALLAPHIPVVFFTWNNLSLHEFDYRPSWFYRNIARHTLPRMHYGLTANHAGIQVLRDAGFKGPVTTVGYGVDTAAFSFRRPERVREIRAALGLAPDDVVVGFVGRMIQMKGIDLLIDAFAGLKRANPQLKLKLLFVGGGPDEDALLRQATRLSLTSDIRHIKSLPQKDIPDYMHALNILVLPSRRVGMWAEQFGRVLVEAMAAGKVVIGSSSGAIPEVIGNAGFVFEENNVEDLTRKLQQALDLPDDKKGELTEAARSRATRDYSWRRFANDAHTAIEFSYRNYGGGRKP